MSIAVTPEQEELASSIRRWARQHVTSEVVRQAFDADAGDQRPDWWSSMAAQGLCAVHLDEEFGGAGAGVEELAVMCEEFGRALLPGAVVPTLVGSLLVQRRGEATLAKSVLPEVASGSHTLAVAIDGGDLRAVADDGGWTVSGTAAAVLGAASADTVIVTAGADDGPIQLAVSAADVVITERASMDNTRRLADVTLAEVHVPTDRRLAADVDDETVALFRLLLAAEAVGVAAWCLDASSEYAKERQQFGVPIGEFQSIKHICADMLVGVEKSAALVWDAAVAWDDDVDADQRRLATAVACAVAPGEAVTAAKQTVQVHGGMGYTWEHDAHLYLRRATTIRQFVGATATWEARVADLTVAGVVREVALEAPEGHELQAELAPIMDEAATLAHNEQRRHLAKHGLLAPHWPKPWGRDADAFDQVVIAREFKRVGVKPPPLVMADWVLPTLIAHGTDDQRERFMWPTLNDEIIWCQMFSEPGAGSDLAGLRTRAERVDGGWELTGQKVWTSVAQFSHWAICLARTDPDAPKHQGITYFLVDMSSEGLDVRPLREMTGHALFNEVFLDKVFVPDENVVGVVNRGWDYARTTLDSERVAIAEGLAVDRLLQECVDRVRDHGEPAGWMRQRLGDLVCRGNALAILGLRATARTLAGLGSASTSSVRKLESAQHKQDTTELGLELLGVDGVVAEDAGEQAITQFLLMRSFTIFGGTTQIQKNLIGERILGLPRDRRISAKDTA